VRAVFAVGDASTALRLLPGRDMLISHAYIGSSWVPVKKVPEIAASASELWIDSGAFTYWQREKKGQKTDTITVEHWAAYLLSGVQFSWAVNLDVIGDAAASVENWRRLCALVGLIADRVVPVWHEGDPIEHLDAYDPDKRVVGLGRTEGRSPGAAGRRKTFQFYDTAFNRYPEGRFHLLGNSNPDLIEPYPARSFDATTWQRDSAYAQSHGFPWCRVSKETRMQAYIEAIAAICHRPAPPEKQLSIPGVIER